jgi:hypothetical protein
MKLKGETAGVYETVVAFPRDGKTFVFKVKAVSDPSEYEKVSPRPVPPMKTLPGNRVVPHFDDKGYKQAMNKWAANQLNWIHIKTLAETDGLEWEKVKLEDPETYTLWTEELREFGLSTVEMNHLYGKIQEVNALSDAKLEEAREGFLLENAAEFVL